MTDDEPLRVSEAARRLGISTREVLVLIHEHRIEYVMRAGIAHIPNEAISDFQAAASN